MPKFGHQHSWQYSVEEALEDPSSTHFWLPGWTINAPTETRFNTKEIRGLKQPGDTDKRRIDDVVVSKNEYPFSLTYIPLKRTSAPKYDMRHFHNMAMNASSASTVDGAWTYGTSLTTAINSFTIFKEIDTIQKQVRGCKISRLTSRSSLDNPVEITVEGLGSFATFADLSRTDASTLRDGTPFMWSDVHIYLDGALATFCTAYEYTINNNAQSNHVLGDRDPKRIDEIGRTVELTITRQFNDTAQYADAKNGVAKSVTIRFDDTADIDIGFRDCKFASHPESGENDGIFTHQLRLNAETMFTN